MSRPTEPIAVPALDLKAQYQTIRDEIEGTLRSVIENQAFVLGPEVSAFEAEVADYCGVAHGVGCASGSDALLLPLMALGIGAGDEVVTTPYTFFATAGAIWRTGARPVFVDIDAETYNIDPVRIEAVLTPRTRAILPVHLYGQTAEMEAIAAIAERHGLTVTRRRRAGDRLRPTGEKRTGGLGHAAAFSFYPSKNLGGFGDAGMVTTNDQGLARQMARLRVHGMEPKYHHHEVGLQLTPRRRVQAAVRRVKLRHPGRLDRGPPRGRRRYRSGSSKSTASASQDRPADRAAQVTSTCITST